MKPYKSPGQGIRSGFTLIEMLVVLAIIALLTSILVPTVSKALRNAKRVREVNNIRQMAQSVLIYHTDHLRLPGRLNRAVRIPSYVPEDHRDRWFSTYMIDMQYLPEDDALFAPVIDYGIRSQGHGYLLNNTVRSDPPNFFGRRSNDASQIRAPLQMSHIRSNILNQEPEREPLGNIWLITNIDNDNYDAGSTAGSEHAVSGQVLTPWGGRHYAFFDGRVEFRKSGDYPSHD